MFCRAPTLFTRFVKVWNKGFNWPVCAEFRRPNSIEISKWFCISEFVALFSTMHFDDVLSMVGGMGAFQWCIFIVYAFVSGWSVESIYSNFIGEWFIDSLNLIQTSTNFRMQLSCPLTYIGMCCSDFFLYWLLIWWKMTPLTKLDTFQHFCKKNYVTEINTQYCIEFTK